MIFCANEWSYFSRCTWLKVNMLSNRMNLFCRQWIDDFTNAWICSNWWLFLSKWMNLFWTCFKMNLQTDELIFHDDLAFKWILFPKE